MRDNGVSAKQLRPSFPPPASVESEAESLAKEHVTSPSSVVSDEEPPSRGEREQCPVIMEVHEYNPERRFVIMNDNSKAPADDTQAKQNPTKLQKINGTETNGQSETNRGQRYEPPSAEQSRAGSARPGPERRRSKQPLPPLQTNQFSRCPPEPHRSPSTAAVDARPPGYFTPRTSRPPVDHLLSPDVI